MLSIFISGRSPLYSHISATLQGLATIRASEEQQQFAEMYNKYQDRNTSGNYYYLAANRWLGYRLDMICASLMTIVSFAPFIAHEIGIGKSDCLVHLLSARPKLNGPSLHQLTNELSFSYT